MALVVLGAGCIKNTPIEKATAALDIVHTVTGVGDIKPNFREEGLPVFKYSHNIGYSTFYIGPNRIGSYSGATRLRLYEIPDTTEKDQPLYDLRLDLPEASINTLLLTGTREDRNYLFIRENLPSFSASDSVMAVRFINCSPESGPVEIHLKGKGVMTALKPQAFRQYSQFVTLPVLSHTQDYEFEARDANTGELLATYKTDRMIIGDHAKFRYRSFSIILTGKAGLSGRYAPALLWLAHTRRI